MHFFFTGVDAIEPIIPAKTIISSILLKVNLQAIAIQPTL